MLGHVLMNSDKISTNVGKEEEELKSFNMHLEKLLNHSDMLMKRMIEIEAYRRRFHEKQKEWVKKERRK